VRKVKGEKGSTKGIKKRGGEEELKGWMGNNGGLITGS